MSFVKRIFDIFLLGKYFKKEGENVIYTILIKIIK